ncbi:39S ribosomal protein L44, mitochondrial [Pseudolycoriella hygida]|uniref:Large ribosomal subunit protein mL44 n=1 Tax=Pseudolycoriella hygida TaxID=35572 RepID=A0A9Q0MT29_9DIPT|nr:39S ribosomal protein L44, mitochondrial [Pseudolycoriella hygida]
MSFFRRSSHLFRILSGAGQQQITAQSNRNIARWVSPTLKEIKRRKDKLPKKPVNRTTFVEWNWHAELFAYSKRLTEDFNLELLQEAFTTRSYIEQEERKQQNVGINNPVTNLKDNSELAVIGADLLSTHVENFISSHLPKLPAAGVRSVRDYLLNDEMLAHIARHLGTRDLVLASEFPCDVPTLAAAFKAVIGALYKSSGNDRTFAFIRDFVCTQLNQKDVDSMWEIERPFEMLQEYCKNNGLAEPEPRLLNDAAKNTIYATYQVGIYTDRKYIAAGFGEDIDTAIFVAALNSLKKFYDIANPRPYDFAVTLKEMEEKMEQNRRKVET